MTDVADRLYERLLVLRCQTDDESAFAELVERYHPRLRYYLRKMLGHADRAEDALQDVWFDVFKGVPRLAEPAAFSTWLYRIARDRAFRELRRRRTNHVPLDEDALAIETGDEESFSAEETARIHAGLDQLAPEHREALMLRFIEGMSYEEVAQVAGCQVGTVRSRIHYAKRALCRALEQTHDKEHRQ